MYKVLLLSLVLLSESVNVLGQKPTVDDSESQFVSDSVTKTNLINPIDLRDVVKKIFKAKVNVIGDTTFIKNKKVQISGLLAPGYSLQTGFAGIIFGNAVFYTTHSHSENVSSLLANLTYTQYNQVIFPFQANIWTKNNNYYIAVDWRFMKYPSLTYGLGGYTQLSDGYSIFYNTIRAHQQVSKSIYKKLYIGIGYNLDYFWNIKEINPPTSKKSDFQLYGLSKTAIASGITFNILFDNRANSFNPEKGIYFNASYRNNLSSLGSSSKSQSLQIDTRKYFKFPQRSQNVIALWNYNWFTLGSNPPYLLLPNTGGDPSSNSGRGYIQGRYRGKNLVYVEAEYRFQISNNGLFGGVLFANSESVSELSNNHFAILRPGYGLGLRVKLNKNSRTNIAIDYGFGAGGSRGFFVNLGEVF
jgi:hypothetical protein